MENADSPDMRMVTPFEGEADNVLDAYGIGIDTHSRFIQCCVLLNLEGEVRRIEETFTTDWEDLQRARAWCAGLVQAYVAVEDHNLHYTIESTGTYHVPVVRAFGGRPRIVNPVLAGGTKRKTDALDARLLAHHDMAGLWRETFVPSDEIAALRVIIGERDRWQAIKLRAGNRIANVVLRFGHTFLAYSKQGTTFTISVLEDLIAGRSPTASGVCPDGLPPVMREVINELLAAYRHAQEQEDLYHKRAMAYARGLDFPVGPDGQTLQGAEFMKLLMTVPGVGERSALAWLAEIVDYRRFANPKSCAAYCGLDPTLKVSAGKVTSYARRGGNARLRHMLTTVAGGLVNRRNEAMGEWGYRLMKMHPKGGYRKAQAAVGRRIAVCLYHIQRTGTPYDASGYQFARVPEVPLVPIESMELGRFTAPLRRRGLTTSHEVVAAFMGGLAAEKGIGDKCLQAIREWIRVNAQGSSFAGASLAERERKSATRLLRKSHTVSSPDARSCS